MLPGGAAVPAATWWRRYEAAGLALMNQHLRAKQHVPALQWLRILERRRRGEPRVLSMVGASPWRHQHRVRRVHRVHSGCGA